MQQQQQPPAGKTDHTPTDSRCSSGSFPFSSSFSMSVPPPGPEAGFSMGVIGPYGPSVGSSGSVNPSPGGRSRVQSQSQSQAQAQAQQQLLQQQHEEESKRRKVTRACDVCRRKKIRCDGPMNSDSRSKCATCQEGGFECTYVEAAKRRGPPKGYLETLEQRCGRLEKLLQQIHPTLDINSIAGPAPDREEFDLAEYNETLRVMRIPQWPATKSLSDIKPFVSASTSLESSVSPPAAAAPSPSLRILGPQPWSTYEQDPNRPPDDDAQVEHDHSEHADLARAMATLEVRDVHWRFHGKASAALLTGTLGQLKYQGTKETLLEALHANRREEYWKIPEWEHVTANETLKPIDYTIWPENDLADLLIEAYFRHANFLLPLLNRVVFRRQYFDERVYAVNSEFAKVCLMVFANGARFVDDERVYWPVDLAMSEEGRQRLQEDTDGSRRYSAGWKYLRAVLLMGKSLMQGPNLYDFQAQVLVCTFLQGSAVPHVMWLLSGVGLRYAQELGIHVRSTMLHADPVERALYNRAFWCLYHVDRLNCAAIGRSVALQDTDFDADYPIAVDDEYWDTGDPERDFKQPDGAGIPQVAAFIQTLKLDHVIGAALRTIYAINKLPEHRADTAAQRAVVVELDSALNSWADAVPDGLRWDPARSDQQLFEQSALLYVHYYYCQILIHRPFIPIPGRSETTNLGLPSLAICSNAARSICNILDAVLRRGRQLGALPGRCIDISFMLPAFTAGILLLLGVYMGRQQPQEAQRALNDVRKVIAATKEMEMSWRQAGKLTDMLSELIKEPKLPDPPTQGQKRCLSGETPESGAALGTPANKDTTSGLNASGRWSSSPRKTSSKSPGGSLSDSSPASNPSTNAQTTTVQQQPVPSVSNAFLPDFGNQLRTLTVPDELWDFYGAGPPGTTSPPYDGLSARPRNAYINMLGMVGGPGSTFGQPGFGMDVNNPSIVGGEDIWAQLLNGYVDQTEWMDAPPPGGFQ